MESSKRPSGLFKGRYIDNRPQRNILRFSDPQQIVEDEYYEEEGVRYTSSKSAIRANERERTQLGKSRKEDRREQGRLSKDLGVDDRKETNL